ncbi:hypothetical protein GCM10007176_05100 [Salinicoccus roseus]|nr:hypothetical protein GCM10007176_05100 [Salinicoccus roseus]
MGAVGGLIVTECPSELQLKGPTALIQTHLSCFSHLWLRYMYSESDGVIERGNDFGT